MKYIFVIGAPGSKWSSVAKDIYNSHGIDRSDNNEQRQYHLASHCGAYFDPGMEFEVPEDLSKYSKEECERMFDAPFNGSGIRIIKSHIFAHNIDYIKSTWADCPVVLVYRADDACLGWWIIAGGFDITYPNYKPYYKDLSNMSKCISAQNKNIQIGWNKYTGTIPANNLALVHNLNLATETTEIKKYIDVEIKVI